jgi:hypothetical protein
MALYPRDGTEELYDHVWAKSSYLIYLVLTCKEIANWIKKKMITFSSTTLDIFKLMPLL